MRWLIDHVSKAPVPAPARDVHVRAIRLPNAHDRRAGLCALSAAWHRDRATVWPRQRSALAEYREGLAAGGGAT